MKPLPDMSLAAAVRRRGMAWMVGLGGWCSLAVRAAEELRFPPPDFESGYTMPMTAYPSPRAAAWEWLDVVLLVGCLGLATWLVHTRRSRRGVTALAAFSLLYFGFLREGCVCAIGSIQNVALALGGGAYALPFTVAVFFAAPLLVSLFFGRTFCSSVCPHGALQDLVVVRPVQVPRWLESALGVVPFLYLGAGAAFAATGAAFVICRYDPFVPLFRLSGSPGMLAAGGALLAIGMFVGRPYCRFLCPYGALLRVGAALSKWRIRITPDHCTQCALCAGTCPFGVIREPERGWTKPRELARARRGIVLALVALPVLVAVGAGVGWFLGGAAARLHPAVDLAEQHARSLTPEAIAQLSLPHRLALSRAERQERELLPRAVELRDRFRIAGVGFGAWSGLVVALKLVSLGMVRRRADYEPDRTGCVACARCFSSCPQERLRLGLTPSAEAPSMGAGSCSAHGGCSGGGAPSPVRKEVVP